MIIAIDGPAAAGKGTLARRLAEAMGLPYLDTGLLYRATALRLLEAGGTPAEAAASIGLADLTHPDLRSETQVLRLRCASLRMTTWRRGG